VQMQKACGAHAHEPHARRQSMCALRRCCVYVCACVFACVCVRASRTGASRPGTTKGRPGTSARSNLVAGLPPRPNTAASVKGNEVLHLPNPWASSSSSGVDEKDFLLDMVKQVQIRAAALPTAARPLTCSGHRMATSSSTRAPRCGAIQKW